MRRADRLFQIVQLIRGRRLTTAQWLAQRLEVSTRTIYRDIADLILQGVPLEGEGGMGYRMGRGFDLPPRMFTQDEANALVITTRMAQQWLDPALAYACESALARVLSVLPENQKRLTQRTAIYIPNSQLTPLQLQHLQSLREAVQCLRRISIQYADAQGTPSMRTIQPLGCFFWGNVWTVLSWCEKQNDHRSFRLDRIIALQDTGTRYHPRPERSLLAYFKKESLSSHCTIDPTTL